MKGSSKSKPTIVLTSLIVLSLLTVLAVARSAAQTEGADQTGFREVLVGLIDSVFERDRGDESRLAVVKTNPPVHRAWHDRVASSRQRAKETIPLVKDVHKETASERRARLAYRLRPKDIPPEYNFFVMNCPLVNEENDFYGPVRFMHKKHASISNDCTVCHHYRPNGPDASETMRCSACHQNSFHPLAPDRIGLKGAIHRQCTGCHKELHQGPIRCSSGCHEKRVRDHTDLVELSGKPDPIQVTKECLRCHSAQGEEMLSSTHWLWKGPSPFTLGQDKRVDLGKATVTVNNFCVSVFSNCPGARAVMPVMVGKTQLLTLPTKPGSTAWCATIPPERTEKTSKLRECQIP